jgi:hypothetical protein
MNGEWSVCLAAGLPRKVSFDDKPEDKRLNLDDLEIRKWVNNCEKRTTIKSYLNGECADCPCKMRLDLEKMC